MPNSPFPPEVPNIGTLVRITPVKIDYVVRHYKDFCEEAYVTSRFFAIDYAGRTFIEVSLGGRMIIEPLRFNPQNQMWLTMFDDQDQQVQLEIIME
jgi:hypothetical protein